MTNEELTNRLADLEAQLKEMKQKQNYWKDFGTFTRENSLGRCRLNTLIARGKVLCDKSNCMTDKLGRAHGVYLYKWA